MEKTAIANAIETIEACSKNILEYTKILKKETESILQEDSEVILIRLLENLAKEGFQCQKIAKMAGITTYDVYDLVGYEYFES